MTTVHAKACIFVARRDECLRGVSADLYYDSTQPWEIRIESVHANLTAPRWMLDSGRTKWVRSACNRRACFPHQQPVGYTSFRQQDAGAPLQVSIRTTTLTEFLGATYTVVPAGAEHDRQAYPTDEQWDGWLYKTVAASVPVPTSPRAVAVDQRFPRDDFYARLCDQVGKRDADAIWGAAHEIRGAR